MADQFLFEQFDVLSQFGAISKDIPSCIKNNIKPSFELRPYQVEAFSRLIHYLERDFDGKQARPYHLLFNMATGSGKTMIMAGAMLYLYMRGYRNFLFFVNSNNIIQKTRDNFLNKTTTKYLFAPKIIIENDEVFVREVESFDETDGRNINIKFTTIQQLHLDLNSTKENAITYEDFEDKQIVLIADEADNFNVATRNDNTFDGNWETTITKIHSLNYANVLLEFTATMDFETPTIKEKYKNKTLFKYDLSQFRKDGYSKEINLLRSQFDEKHRVIQALVLNLYRQELATSHNINLKPVILFKAKKTISESERNKERFHRLIEDLNVAAIDEVRNGQDIKILQTAFCFFEKKGITSEEIVKRLKANFRPENCLSANNDAEAERNQILLNTLEDENNPLRAIFAVNKLDRGWDVLNLFDIVRMYEGQNTGGSNNGGVGGTTRAEAQLIGRGARYYPFTLEHGQNKFVRKFDSDNDNELKVLEELYYHTKEDSRYISELKKALVESGIYEDENDIVERKLTLKESFKKSSFYRNAQVVFNLKIEKKHDKVKSLADLKVRKTNIEFILSSGKGLVTSVWDNMDVKEIVSLERRNVTVGDIPKHIVLFALTTNPFFYFNNLKKYCPALKSKDEFVEKEEYLGGFGISFKGDESRCENISPADYLQALKVLLQSIEAEIRQNDTEYEGTEFAYHDYVRNKFTDKTLHINKKRNEERTRGQEEFLAEKSWYAYNANFGTSEEKKFVEMFASRYQSIKAKYNEVYLIRNEQTLKIYDEIGRAFEPDFVLFCQERNGQENIIQLFIEPKGSHLESKDKWKEDFLKRIRQDRKAIEIGTDHYVITGVPFYNYNSENEFGKELEKALM